MRNLRNDFPILGIKENGKPLTYLDNAATTHQPRFVLDAVTYYYSNDNANPNRGVYDLALRATEVHENARGKIASFIGAKPDEIVFTKNCTESLNLIAYSYGRKLNEDDEIVLAVSEHHSNIVPWQKVARERGCTLKYLYPDKSGRYPLSELESKISDKTRVVAVAYVSNVLGIVNPVKEISKIAHRHGAVMIADMAQAVPHMRIDVKDLDVDFAAFSGHKMYAPMGVGVMYGREELLEDLPPYQGGGEMIQDVTFEKTTYNELPFKFEAGTPSVGDVIALGAAIDFLHEVGFDYIVRHEGELVRYAFDSLAAIPGIRFYGTAPDHSGVVSFLIGDCSPYDVGTLLDKVGIAVRTGHHCTQPVMERYGIPGTVRASFACYTSQADIDALVAGLRRVLPLLT